MCETTEQSVIEATCANETLTPLENQRFIEFSREHCNQAIYEIYHSRSDKIIKIASCKKCLSVQDITEYVD